MAARSLRLVKIQSSNTRVPLSCRALQVEAQRTAERGMMEAEKSGLRVELENLRQNLMVCFGWPVEVSLCLS